MQNPLIAAPSELKGEVFQFLDKLSVYQNVDAGEHPVCKRRVDGKSRKFKAKFDINIIQYIKLVRIRHAKQLLMSSGKKISEISLLVGYDDEKYFSRVFKEMEKISANDYRKKFSNK